jgi:peptidoglycan/xylan/chitin deacetylase (PgdA/CDA1 family)
MFIERPPVIYRTLFQGVVWRIPAEDKCVYLTFDDGPVPHITPWVIYVLERYNIKATFFCVGDNVRKHPDEYRLLTDSGHAVGNHTYNHIQGISHNSTDYLANIEKAGEYIDSRLFRPPHGHLRLSQTKAIMQKYDLIMWDVVTRDYSPRMTPDKVFANVRDYTRNGSIIVFHDSVKAERNMKGALPTSIEWLLEQGYQFKILTSR